MLEVGMYVRNEKGIIGKIYEKKGNMFFYKDSNRDYITYELSHGEILKASHNIIDLIEVGDYVNGSLVVEVGEDRVFTNIYYEDGYYNSFVGADEDWNSSYVSDYSQEIICDYEIKSIVTREQFEQMQYKVGE